MIDFPIIWQRYFEVEIPKALYNEMVNSIARSGCAYSLCNGPDKRPINMVTCHRCWTYRHIMQFEAKQDKAKKDGKRLNHNSRNNATDQI